MDFASLSAEERAAVREKQQQRKRKKRDAKKAGATVADEPAAAETRAAQPDKTAAADFPTSITRDEYFAACGLFRDPNLPPTEQSLDVLLGALGARDKQARRLGRCNYFQFCGPDHALWDPVFNARLAYEGFFTITTMRRGVCEPLPELQPFYGVLTWPNFEDSKHVRKALARARKSTRTLRLVDCVVPQRTWSLLDAYHSEKWGSNWLTQRYFEMLRQGSVDPAINFTVHCVELHEEGSDLPLAGEIGFSVGRVYTSLSGWTGQRSSDGLGTIQLVLLGRWLQQRGYVFWSLGHCYSPEMEYKRELGHRVYPRTDFLELMRRHRGSFRPAGGEEAAADGAFRALAAGDSCEAAALLWPTGATPPALAPQREPSAISV